MKKLVFIALLIIAGNTRVAAQVPKVVTSDKDGWHKLAETTVNFKTETDDILVVGANRFSALKIKVTDAPVNIQSFDIYFNKGEKQSVTIGQEIKSPGETRVVDLQNGGERNINKISFRYNTAAGNADKRAHLEVWGLKTNPGKK